MFALWAFLLLHLPILCLPPSDCHWIGNGRYFLYFLQRKTSWLRHVLPLYYYTSDCVYCRFDWLLSVVGLRFSIKARKKNSHKCRGRNKIIQEKTHRGGGHKIVKNRLEMPPRRQRCSGGWLRLMAKTRRSAPYNGRAVRRKEEARTTPSTIDESGKIIKAYQRHSTRRRTIIIAQWNEEGKMKQRWGGYGVLPLCFSQLKYIVDTYFDW